MAIHDSLTFFKQAIGIILFALDFEEIMALIKLNELEVEVPDGINVVEAARMHGRITAIIRD